MNRIFYTEFIQYIHLLKHINSVCHPPKRAMESDQSHGSA